MEDAGLGVALLPHVLRFRKEASIRIGGCLLISERSTLLILTVQAMSEMLELPSDLPVNRLELSGEKRSHFADVPV